MRCSKPRAAGSGPSRRCATPRPNCRSWRETSPCRRPSRRRSRHTGEVADRRQPRPGAGSRGATRRGAAAAKGIPPLRSPGPRGAQRGQKKTGARLVVQSPAPVAQHGNGDVRDGGGSSVCSCSSSVYAARGMPVKRVAPRGGCKEAALGGQGGKRPAPCHHPAASPPRGGGARRGGDGLGRRAKRARCYMPRRPPREQAREGRREGARGGCVREDRQRALRLQASACRRAARRAGWLLERGLKPRRRPLRRGMARRWTSKTSGPARGRRRLLSAPYAARGILPGVLTAARGGCMMAPLEMSPARGAANTPSAQKCPGDGVAVPGPGQQVLAAGASSVAHREARRHSLLAGPCCGLSVAGPGRRRAAQRHKRRCALSSFWRNDGEKWG